jgi:hypothetical protein
VFSRFHSSHFDTTEYFCSSRHRPGEHPLAESNDDDDEDDDDDDVPGLMRDSDQEPSLDGNPDEHDSQEESDMGSDYDDDEDGSDEDDEDRPSDVPGLVDSEGDVSEGHDRSEGWQTAEEDSEDEAERRGGSDHGRRVRSRRVSLPCHCLQSPGL